MNDSHSQTASRRVWLLGALRVEDETGAIEIPSGNAQSLFAYLTLSPTIPHTRERLADLLWPDAPPDRIGHNFSDLLYRLRQALGEDWLEIQDDRIALHAGADLWVDVREFERLAQSDDLADLERAVALYTGDLLPEVYDDWILAHRVALEEGYFSVLLRLGQAAEGQNLLDKAFTYYHRLSYADPLNEEAHRGLMRVYARRGRYAAALEQYEHLRQLLADELQVDPVSDTIALAQAIRAEYQSALAEVSLQQPFVGRRRERALLLRQAEQAGAGRGGLVLVEGEPGVGKTRLLEMVAEGARWRGLTVAWGRARELAGTTPYVPLDQALQAALAGPRAGQLRGRLSPVVVEALAALAPRLRAGPLMQLPTLPDLPAALGEGLGALGELNPHLIILDDVQWAGPAFWDALAFAEHLRRMPVLVILVYRPEGLRTDQDAWEALQDLDLRVAPQRLEVRGLTLTDCADLALELGYELPDNEVLALHQATAGNPLYVQEALAAYDGSITRSESLESLLRRRLAGLSPDARAPLEIAAVLGREFRHGVWQSVAGGQVLTAIPELMAARFIQETDQGYVFQHDLVRQHVYQAVPADRLRRYHQQTAEALLRQDAASETLAWHFEQAEMWPQAVEHYRLAGDRALGAYAYATALQLFEKALSLRHHLPDAEAEYLALLSRRQRVFHLVGRLSDWRADVDEIERLATAADEPDTLLNALESRMKLQVLDSDLEGLQATAERALALARETGDLATEARLLETLGQRQGEILGEMSRSIGTLQRAAALAEAAQDYPSLVSVLCKLSDTQVRMGQCAAAQASASRALTLTQRRLELYPARPHALLALAVVAYHLADWETARVNIARVVQLHVELNDLWALAETEWQLAVVASAMGQHAEAIETLLALRNRAIQDGIPSDSIILRGLGALLAKTCTLAGEFEAAERELEGIQDWINTAPETRFLVWALTALGQLRLAQKCPHEAVIPLARAARLWKDVAWPMDLETLLLHAIAARRAGDLATARASLAQAEGVLSQSDVVRFDVLAHYARSEVSGAPADLLAAREEMLRQAAQFEDDRLRADFLGQVRLHQEIEARWQALGGHPATLVVSLARADVPLGKELTDDDRVRVHWTVDAGEADAEVLRRHGKVALRRHRLQRVLAEAAAQGASPTDDDLAQALRVSRRTILRDMQHLAKAGVPLPTRRRAKG